MACIPYEAVYGCYLGVMFSSRTRFLIKQLVGALCHSRIRDAFIEAIKCYRSSLRVEWV
jgi:hypothetical protein